MYLFVNFIEELFRRVPLHGEARQHPLVSLLTGT
jgi:hypothetical protein